MAPGRIAGKDYEYARGGTANIFCIVEPRTGRRLNVRDGAWKARCGRGRKRSGRGSDDFDFDEHRRPDEAGDDGLLQYLDEVLPDQPRLGVDAGRQLAGVGHSRSARGVEPA
jgi:hypothetical protein